MGTMEFFPRLCLFARIVHSIHALLAGNSEMKEEAQLVTIFLVPAGSRVETLCIVCCGPGNGKVKLSEQDASSTIIYKGKVFRV